MNVTHKKWLKTISYDPLKTRVTKIKCAYKLGPKVSHLVLVNAEFNTREPVFFRYPKSWRHLLQQRSTDQAWKTQAKILSY